MKLKKIASIVFLLAISISIKNNNLYGQAGRPIPSDKPKLVIGIIVSQFRHDYISRYWDQFSDGGFKKMVSRGTYCKNTSYNYLLSDKGVGIASITTGTAPSYHGIVASSWYNDLKEQIIPSIYDMRYNTVGGPFEAGQCSPHQLLCSSFGDELNLNNNFKSKVVGVSLEPVSAVLSAGHTAHAAYWFDIQKGNFISSSFYMDSLPTWVNTFNDKALADIYMEKDWNLLLPASEYKASLPDDNPYEEGFRNKTTFPYQVEKVAKMYRNREKYAVLNTIPYGDNLLKDFAIQTIVSDSLGMDEHTDILFVNFTANEQIGQLFGPLSVEIQDAVLRLDKDLEHFLNFIDDAVGMENTLIFFTAEHGIGYNPQYLIDHNIPAGYFNSNSAISLTSSYLNNIYGKGDWIKQYNAQQVYLNRTLIESADIPLDKFQRDVSELLLQFHGVQNTLTSSQLMNNNYEFGAFNKMQNGYNQKRSGDIIINLKNGYLEKQGRNVASHGNDPRIPLVWYGWKIGRKTVVEPVSLIDIAPTISVLLETNYPNSSTGTPIEAVIKK